MKVCVLTFVLDEEVTPELFAEKIAVACATHGAIREGEGVKAFLSRNTYTHSGYQITDLDGILKKKIEVPIVEKVADNDY